MTRDIDKLTDRLLPTIEERATVGAVFLGAASLILLVRDGLGGSEHGALYAVVHAARLAFYVATGWYLRLPRGRFRASLVTFAGLAMLTATTAGLAPARGDLGTYFIVSVGVALGTAALIPWAAYWQLAAAVLFAASLMVANAAVAGASPISANTMFAYFMAMAGSVYLSAWFGFRRRAAAEAVAEIADIQKKLGELNLDLERRVAARTVDLERANTELEVANREYAAANRDLEQAYRELEGFTYSVSHDLRVPLRVIAGLSHLVQEEYGEGLQEGGRSYIERIRQAAIRVGEVADDLLTLARVPRDPISPDDLDLTRLVHRVVAERREADPDRTIDVDVVDGLRACADAALARVVVEQLLSNAWKFTRRSEEPSVEVGAARVDGQCGLFVRDNGIGFPAELAGKLFNRFERLHDEPEIEGTGIGLAAVSRIVARHGGSVWAEGARGSGATFYVTFPERPEKVRQPAAEPAPEIPAGEQQ